MKQIIYYRKEYVELTIQNIANTLNYAIKMTYFFNSGGCALLLILLN